ncbi:MAG: DUF1801 domain-containing protein [Candidatus Thermoplasmatota archaeon]|nr:DUF1801 domain-containing protein [Candidatus Thermoplasmatota archaeon]
MYPGGSGLVKYETIDDYINDQPEGTKKALLVLKECILEAAPDAIETFNFDIPAFSLVEDGKRDQQIMIAGYKKHVGLYPHPTVIDRFADELKDYRRGKGSVQFPIDKPIPRELVISMILYRKRILEIT